MKMMALLFLGLIMSLSTLCADVVVYRGTARVVGDLTTTGRVPGVIVLYLLVDFETRQSASIGFWNKGGVKRFIGGFPANIDMAEANIVGGRTGTVLASGTNSSTDETTFSHSILFLRGKNTELLIQKEPAITRIARPRALTGHALNLNSSTTNRTFSELTLALSFDQRTTIAANEAGRTLAETTDDLEMQLTNKGYTPL